jgi:hypothetical protein
MIRRPNRPLAGLAMTLALILMLSLMLASRAFAGGGWWSA